MPKYIVKTWTFAGVNRKYYNYCTI